MPAVRSAVAPTRTIKWLYIFALSMVAMLTISGQVLVQWSLATLEGDSTTVNVAGRQRMLSQRIPRLILALDASVRFQTTELSPEDQQSFVATEELAVDLGKSLELWQTNHLGLASASQTVGLSRSNSRPISELFVKIEPHFARVQQVAAKVLERFNRKDAKLLSDRERAEMLEHSDAFLTSMDAIVARYELEAKQRVSRLQWMERGLLIATLLVLMCEGLFIFSPAIASLNRAFDRLNTLTNQLELAKKVAEQANDAKTQFLARVSHELRTPLHAILGMLSLLRRSRLSSQQLQRANLAYQASRSLRHLVDDLLDVASAENGSPIELHLEQVNVSKVINDCVELMHGPAKRKRLRVHATHSLPEGTTCLLDEFRLRQILINLIQNAIRYTAVGEVECRAWFEESTDAQTSPEQFWLNISVRDTGCGIAPENHDRIFENFVRINANDSGQILGPRMGLGLPITASLVKTMKGTIAVESKPGEGSVFTVRLPTVISKNTSESKHSPSIASDKTDPACSTSAGTELRALVVDDSKVNRLLLRDYLKQLGIRVSSTNNLERALELYKRTTPRLILLDLNVGRQQSLGLATAIRSSPNGGSATIFVITADGHFEIQDCPAAADIAGIIRKPIEFAEFSKALRPALKLLQQSSALSSADESEFDALRADLRRMLIAHIPNEICQLSDAYEKQDYATLQLIAHRLHGSAANASCNEIAEASANFELQVKSSAELGLSLTDEFHAYIKMLEANSRD